MMCTHYKKVLFALCFCSLQTIFCMESAPDKDSVAPQGKGLSLNPIELASKYKLSQKTGTFFNATERVLRKTVDVAGKATTQTLGFVWHHPFISLGVTGAVLMYSPALRSYIYNVAWNKGFAHARATARGFLGLNEQDARLARLEGASDIHTGQLTRIEAASGLHTERLTELAESSDRNTERLDELSADVGAVRGIADDHTGRLDGLAAGLEDIRTSQRSFVDRIAHVDVSIEAMRRGINDLGEQAAWLPTEIAGLHQAVYRLSINQAQQFSCLREDISHLTGRHVASRSSTGSMPMALPCCTRPLCRQSRAPLAVSHLQRAGGVPHQIGETSFAFVQGPSRGRPAFPLTDYTKNPSGWLITADA